MCWARQKPSITMAYLSAVSDLSLTVQNHFRITGHLCIQTCLFARISNRPYTECIYVSALSYILGLKYISIAHCEARHIIGTRHSHLNVIASSLVHTEVNTRIAKGRTIRRSPDCHRERSAVTAAVTALLSRLSQGKKRCNCRS